KILPPELSTRPDLVERFSREARALARLDHPNIVKIFDFGRTTAGHLYFVMEFVDGLDLGRILRSRSLETPPQDHGATLEIIGQICQALHYAHGKGIVHRDIKPANVLLSKEGHVKVADFGLARATEPEDGSTGLKDGEAVTMSGMVMGTLEYMAPEQQEGRRVDHRADIYALGVLFYQMLTGQLPRGAFLPPSRKSPSIDARLDKVVLKALQTEPAQRYQRASEMGDALQALVKLKTPPPPRPLQSRSSAAASANSSERFPWTAGRLRVIGGAVTALLLLTAALYGILNRRPAASDAGALPAHLTLAEALPASQKVSDGIYEVPLPPDRRLPLSAFYQVKGQPLNLTFSAPGYHPVTLPITPGLAPPAVRLEPVVTPLTWKSDPPGWFTGASLERQDPPTDPRLESTIELTPGTRKVPSGTYRLSGLWGNTAIPLQTLAISALPAEATLKWPHPDKYSWSGILDLNPRPVLMGVTAPYQKIAADWTLPIAAPLLLELQPGGTATLRVLNPQIMQLALLAIMGGSLPENQLEDENAVHALFQEKVLRPLASQNTSPTRLGTWFAELWKEQSRTALATSGDPRRAAVFAQFRDQAAFLTTILTSPDPAAALQNARGRNLISLFFDEIPHLRPDPGSASRLSLQSPDGLHTVSAEWSGQDASYQLKDSPVISLKTR
ncbi:MAG: serine/threonine protein kinase, partial [Verrucomicrobiales bacterium]|nr:serine/threonine protein kinase [Verrucomicrobiales bacterium]